MVIFSLTPSDSTPLTGSTRPFTTGIDGAIHPGNANRVLLTDVTCVIWRRGALANKLNRPRREIGIKLADVLSSETKNRQWWIILSIVDWQRRGLVPGIY